MAFFSRTFQLAEAMLQNLDDKLEATAGQLPRDGSARQDATLAVQGDARVLSDTGRYIPRSERMTQPASVPTALPDTAPLSSVIERTLSSARRDDSAGRAPDAPRRTGRSADAASTRSGSSSARASAPTTAPTTTAGVDAVSVTSAPLRTTPSGVGRWALPSAGSSDAASTQSQEVTVIDPVPAPVHVEAESTSNSPTAGSAVSDFIPLPIAPTDPPAPASSTTAQGVTSTPESDMSALMAALAARDDTISSLLSNAHVSAGHAAHLERECVALDAQCMRLQSRVDELEAQIVSAYAEAADARRATEAFKSAAEADARAHAWEAKYTALKADYDAAAAAHAQALGGARAEAARLEAALEASAVDMERSRTRAHMREEALSVEVEALHAEIVRFKSNVVPHAVEPVVTNVEEAHASAAQVAALEVALTRARMDAEAARGVTAELEARLATTSASLADTRTERDALVAALQARINTLTARLESETAAGVRANALAETVATLTRSVEDAHAHAHTLKVKLDEERVAHAKTAAELEVAQSRAAAAGHGDEDDAPLDSAWARASTPPRELFRGVDDAPGATAPLRARASVAVTPLRTTNLAKQSRSLANAAVSLDSFMLHAGRFMFKHPAARMGLFAYLLTLHMWCATLLLFHTHALPHATHARNAPGGPNFNPRSAGM